MDTADQAQIIEQENLQRAMANRQKNNAPSNFYCEDCEEEIPPQRRQHAGVTRCIDCQQYVDALNKHYS